MAEYLGLKLRHVDTTEAGGSSYLMHVGHAAHGHRGRQVSTSP